MFKIQGTGCYNIDVTFISSEKRWSSKICQIRIPARFQVFLHLKKDGKVFGKNTVTF